jgi:heat shock protein HslJ
VNIKKIKNPAADGSSLRYKLVKIIYQEQSKVALQTKSLHGNWKVSKMMGIDSLAKSPTLIIDTESNKVSGNAGCNKYGASYTIDGNIINFETPFATKMYCTNMKIEDAFFDCLSKAVYYKLDNENLQLFSKENELLLTCNIAE